MGINRRRMLAGVAVGGLMAGQAEAALAGVSPGGVTHWIRRRAPFHKKAGPKPVVRTASGPVRGRAEGTISVFKGIPYAAPTGGANRFKPPRPREPWSGVLEAASFGRISPQPSFPVIVEERGSQAFDPQGEDCLVLNVWTPSLQARLPVMVWFHGGGYVVGGGSAPWYDGTALATHQGVVVVTINHRLNVFGFLDLSSMGGEAFSGNAGMLDCVAALEWVRANISGFGGDPGNVTIFGESGGAGKVSTLMAMPAAKGLFHKAIAESGAALTHSTREATARTAKALFDQLGLQPGDIAGLQALPVETILAATGKMRPPGAFGPVVDGRDIPSNPFDPGAPEISADVPFMTGTNLTEATFFADTPLDPIDDATLRQKVKQYTHVDDSGADELISLYRTGNPGRDNVFVYQLIASDYWMRSGVLLQAERKAAQGRAPVYVYQFNWLSKARGGKLHCPHGSEIPFAFDNVHTAPELLGSGPAQSALAAQMSAAWAAFARTGKPGADRLPDWPTYGADGRAVMIFDAESRVEHDPGGPQRIAIAALKTAQARA